MIKEGLLIKLRDLGVFFLTFNYWLEFDLIFVNLYGNSRRNSAILHEDLNLHCKVQNHLINYVGSPVYLFFSPRKRC